MESFFVVLELSRIFFLHTCNVLFFYLSFFLLLFLNWFTGYTVCAPKLYAIYFCFLTQLSILGCQQIFISVKDYLSKYKIDHLLSKKDW